MTISNQDRNYQKKKRIRKALKKLHGKYGGIERAKDAILFTDDGEFAKLMQSSCHKTVMAGLARKYAN